MEEINKTLSKTTRSRINHYIYILNAYLKGETIHCRYIFNNGEPGIWSEVKNNTSHFDFINYKYAILPKIRPYKNINEFYTNYKERKIRCKDSYYIYEIKYIGHKGLILDCNGIENHFTYTYLFEHFEYEDGEPIGIKLT